MQTLRKELPLYHVNIIVKLILGYCLTANETTFTLKISVNHLVPVAAALLLGVVGDLGARVLAVFVAFADVVQQIQRLDRDLGALARRRIVLDDQNPVVQERLGLNRTIALARRRQ